MVKGKVVAAATVSLLIGGCFNLPTAPEQIAGSYTSGLKYEQFDCQRLGAEFESLARREEQLVVAQGERRRAGKVQAFFLGFGQGDGLEATELANVRGEKEAVRKALDAKPCAPRSVAAPETSQ
jgi:hypothetical protein